jgi:hypothetical protein
MSVVISVRKKFPLDLLLILVIGSDQALPESDLAQLRDQREIDALVRLRSVDSGAWPVRGLQ